MCYNLVDLSNKRPMRFMVTTNQLVIQTARTLLILHSNSVAEQFPGSVGGLPQFFPTSPHLLGEQYRPATRTHDGRNGYCVSVLSFPSGPIDEPKGPNNTEIGSIYSVCVLCCWLAGCDGASIPLDNIKFEEKLGLYEIDRAFDESSS